MPDAPEEREPDRCDLPLVPEYDVRNCIVCTKPMEGRKCKYVCRCCGYIVDCSDPY